jgi:hypothetical protein
VNLKEFKSAVKSEPARTIDICQVDHDCYEIMIRGSWIASSNEAHEGMFVAVMSDRTEFFVEKIWKATQDTISSFA